MQLHTHTLYVFVITYIINMSQASLIDSVRNYLATNYMFVVEDWLSGCVEYLTEDNNSLSEREIQNLAKEQWLLNNLKDICPGSLPANIKNQHKFLLNGKFVLQINAAIDIGTPAYQQYLKLKKVNMENVEATTKFEDKVPNHRMIKLYMTDGVQEICGIEFKPMRNISCDITPGCKVLIKGPVECRRGILLLTEAVVELLGGEVQEIAETNSLPGLLSSKLGLPMIEDADMNTTENQRRNTDLPTPHAQMPTWNNEPQDHTSRPVARVTSVQVANFADEDIDFDQLEAIEAQFIEHPAKRPMIDEHSKPDKKLKMNPVESVNRVEDYPDDVDLLHDDDDYLRELEADFDAKEKELYDPNPKGPIALQPEPFVYIKQINDLKEDNKMGRVFSVKGQIMKLLSKLSVGKDGWSLKCTLVDGSGCIDVEFTSEVLSQIVGYTPQEMNRMKKQMSSQPELREKAVLALQKAKDTLQVLYCIIELTILDTPKITKITPFDDSHVCLLKKRLEESGL